MTTTPPPLTPADVPAAQDAGAASPLTAEQLMQFQQAQERAAKFRRATGMAMFNAVTFGICAAGSALVAMISLAMGERDIWGVILTLGLCAAAWCEWRGRAMLLALDVRGPRLLGWNQVGLMTMVAVYCAWQIGQAFLTPLDPAAAQSYAQIKSSLGIDMAKFYRQATLGFYVLVAMTVFLFQGLCARYYFSRGKILKDYLAQTPQWIIDLRRMQQPGK
ncbi:MAG: hypothetical protein ABFD92_09305 [Planctomycetaceae bacterium]|nr:hypothetical protein [Planctomycetaceae bacterium]